MQQAAPSANNETETSHHMEIDNYDLSAPINSPHIHNMLGIAVHAVLLESGVIRIDPVSFDFMKPLSYTLPNIVCPSSINDDLIIFKFQRLGKFFTIYGSLVNGKGAHCATVDETQLFEFLNVCGLDGWPSKIIMPRRVQVFQFWRAVKDKLALPLLIDLCEKAGLSPPLCFTSLLPEIKLKIIESLPGDDIAKVACVCSELRCLASGDDLWKKKYGERFGCNVNSQGGIRWKDKFGERLRWKFCSGIQPAVYVLRPEEVRAYSFCFKGFSEHKM